MKDIDDLFNRYTRAVNTHRVDNHEIITKCDWSPLVIIAENDNTFVIRVNIFDINKKNIKVSLENGVLKIFGEKKVETEIPITKYYRFVYP